MREIKFRAWDLHKRVFIPNDVYAVITSDFNAFGIMLKDWEDYKEGEYFYANSQVPMQFTGLLDKNGVEIYEGDILKRCEGISFVVWGLDGWRFNSWMPGEMRLYYHVDKTRGKGFELAEVIGNIHQHPELLTPLTT